ncbi:MAG: glycosyltransferase family 2 protein [Opitutae bacterium]|nr:glycosyltransferase family 2 protein [Opitutae bacterium]MBT6461194.1 glycosyltransferase family 2 protein [Opitutae bacterium]
MGGAITLLEDEGVPASSDYDFQRWLWRNHPRPWQLREMSREWEAFPSNPLFSILLPVCHPEPTFLAAALESVLNQVYPNWQLCVWLDGPQAVKVQRLLEAYSKLDDRIKVGQGGVRCHISHASNQALGTADGDFIALLDQDDIYPPHALYRIAEHLSCHPEHDFVYSDETNLDDKEKLCRPFFKPDWSPDYFNSIMYTCHLQVFRRSFIDKVGGFRERYEGSQDWDLVLRLTEKTNAIGHVSDILYYWRIHSGSTAKEGSEAKPYAKDAAIRAISEAIERRGEPGIVRAAPRAPGCYEVRYNLVAPGRVSILIPFRDQADVLDRCLQSINSSELPEDCELVLVDNVSSDPSTKRVLDKWSEVFGSQMTLLSWSHPFNYARLHNDVVPECAGKYLVFLNNDTEVLSTDWLSALMEYAQKPRVGAVGGLLMYPDQTIQHAGVLLGLGGAASHAYRGSSLEHMDYFNRARLTGNFLSICTACMMCRKDVFSEVGGFDECFSHNYNDVDFCLKLHSAGYWNVYLPYVQLIHHESKTRGSEESSDDIERFSNEFNLLRKRWLKEIENDPFYNIHLTRDFEDFRIKDPCYYKAIPSQKLY